MQKNIFLPQVELTMESVQVIGWLVKVGDHVSADQTILEVESQKGLVEVPAPEAGHVRRLCVNQGDTIGEKALLCILTDEPGEPISEVAAVSAASKISEKPPSPGATPTETDSGGIKAAPAARKLARELGIDLATIKPTGPGGRITVEDVQKIGQSGNDWTPIPSWRVALLEQMRKSLAEIPQFHVTRKLNVAPLMIKAEGITFTHRLVRAVALALVKHPVLRTLISGETARVLPVSVAVAMDTPHGLTAPAVRKADQLSLEQIASELKELRARAEEGKSRRENLVDAPFAVSNLGMLGVDFFTPFVFHGQTAVLAIGRAIEGQAWFTLAADHRVVDGAEAARFLATFQNEITGISK